jgi:catechol 2,3-dioxygenase-like lactoylglutathione lyase family enzyme
MMASVHRVERLDHVQLAMPVGGEERATAFYEGVCGIPRVPKPAELAARGGCWFERDGLRVHLGVEEDFRPARKAHPALSVTGIDALCAALAAAGYPVRRAEDVPGRPQWYVDDPFGNRIELVPA